MIYEYYNLSVSGYLLSTLKKLFGISKNQGLENDITGMPGRIFGKENAPGSVLMKL